ncbi:MAG: bifunctional oligoribonuclease/PAP phosphatase NrnA [Opitutales bacterium]
MIKDKFFPELENRFLELIKALESKKIAVLGHMRPDGDCIGSQVAIAKFLRKYANCADVICINKDAVPFVCQEYAKTETFYLADDFKDTSYEILTVDCASYKRTSDNINELFPQAIASIDHHLSNNAYGKFNVIYPEAASTTELLTGLFLDGGFEIDAEIASALYLGLVTDTQQFTTNSTTERTLKVAAELIARGANCTEISINLYQQEKFGKMQLLSRYLDRLELSFDGKVCGGYLLNKDFEETSTNRKTDCEGLVDYARSVNGVEIAYLIEELSDGTKASLRSKSPIYNVNEIAVHLEGGGHACAAGCTLKGVDVEEFKAKLIGEIEAKLKQI